MMTKLRIKFDDMEIESEGEEQFVKKELLDIVAAAAKLRESLGIDSDSRVNGAENRDSSRVRRAHDSIQLTTSSIATKLGAQSGPDLLLAAAAQLTFVQNKDSFTRRDLLNQARTASAYYNENVRKNLSSHLNSLVKGNKLNEVSVGVFALHAKARAELETKVAG
jgi:hypothetical protein